MRFLLASSFLLALLALGCGGESLSEVSGTVQIDGKPLAEGEIIFEAADNSVAPSSAVIALGKYTLKVAPGPKKVRIRASRASGKIDPMMKTKTLESIIPPEFNDKTTLKADIKPGKNDGVDFQVKESSKK
jgi:hypothetical protein